MQYFIAVGGPIGDVLDAVLPQLIDPAVCGQAESAAEADLIIVFDESKLHEVYSTEKKFAVFSVKEIKFSAANVRWISVFEYITDLTAYVSEIAQEINGASPDNDEVNQVRAIEMGVEYVPKNKEHALHVLVVDDKQENLLSALELLGEKHFLTLASGYGEGKQLIRANKYDVVLSDCQMPIQTKGSALSMEAITLSLGEVVHNGPFLMFPATKSGARFAIVTDANHHQDWVSAIFDDLRDPQIINGQPVLFINYMGKDWDKALEKLMSL
jgi:hypothetical protein